MTMTSEYGHEASKSNPCPLCDGQDWCFQIDRWVWACGRIEPNEQPKGWKFRKRAKDSRAIFSFGTHGDRQWKPLKRVWNELKVDTGDPNWPLQVLHHIETQTILDRELSVPRHTKSQKCDTHTNAGGEGVSGDSVTCDVFQQILTAKDAETLLKKQNTHGPVFPFQVLPEPLRVAIANDAAQTSTDPINFIQLLFPVCASLMGVSELNLWGFRSPNIVWTATVQESGGGKSRAYSLVVKPLLLKQIEYFAAYKSAIEDYEKEVEVTKGKTTTKRPTLKKIMFESTTLEAVDARLGEQDTPSAVWARDELAGLFKGLGQYKNGKGDDTERLLSMWDGNGSIVDRKKATDCFAISDNRVSITGGIQPSVFDRVFQDHEGNGMAARLLLTRPYRPQQVWRRGEKLLPCELGDLYHFLEKELFDLVEAPDELEELWKDWYDTSAEEESKASCKAVKEWMRKIHSHASRLALTMHGIYCHYDRTLNPQVLDANSLIAGIALADYYKEVLVHYYSSEVDTMSHLCEIVLEFVKARGNSVPVKDIYRSLRKVREAAKVEGITSPTLTNKICDELEELGLAKITTGSRGGKVISVFPNASA